MSRDWNEWYSTQKLCQVAISPHSDVIVAEHRRGSGYFESLSADAMVWCEEREIPLPQMTLDTSTGGWILTFEEQDQAFEFKMRWV